LFNLTSNFLLVRFSSIIELILFHSSFLYYPDNINKILFLILFGLSSVCIAELIENCETYFDKVDGITKAITEYVVN